MNCKTCGYAVVSAYAVRMPNTETGTLVAGGEIEEISEENFTCRACKVNAGIIKR
jgi:hypothetical protein